MVPDKNGERFECSKFLKPRFTSWFSHIPMVKSQSNYPTQLDNCLKILEILVILDILIFHDIPCLDDRVMSTCQSDSILIPLGVHCRPSGSTVLRVVLATHACNTHVLYGGNGSSAWSHGLRSANGLCKLKKHQCLFGWSSFTRTYICTYISTYVRTYVRT